MNYEVEFKPRAVKDLESIPRDDRRRVVERIEMLSNALQGDVKKLTNFSPEYRLRVGNYRILFEVKNDKVVIYRVLPRKDAYR